MIDYNNPTPEQQEVAKMKITVCANTTCEGCPLNDVVGKDEGCYAYCMEHPEEARRLLAQASVKIADTAQDCAPPPAEQPLEKIEQLDEERATVSKEETVDEEEEREVNLKDYTPEQLMARGAVDIVCLKTSNCDDCLLRPTDGGQRPIACSEYAIRYPAEVLDALGVKGAPTVAKMETVGETTTAPITRAECLDKAKACVTGHREQDYGKPENNFAVIAKLWSAYLDCEVDRQDVANMMILQKMGRITSGTATADSYVDIAGYAACGCEIATKETE